jgi:hypothetical protein
MTRRKEMIELLRKQPMTMHELARTFRAETKEILVDLEHIAYTVKPTERLVMNPATCRSCGFIFRTREKRSKPSKCPACKREKITEPIFSITSV